MRRCGDGDRPALETLFEFQDPDLHDSGVWPLNTATSVAAPSQVAAPSFNLRFDHLPGPVTAIVFVGLLVVPEIY